MLARFYMNGLLKQMPIIAGPIDEQTTSLTSLTRSMLRAAMTDVRFSLKAQCNRRLTEDAYGLKRTSVRHRRAGPHTLLFGVWALNV